MKILVIGASGFLGSRIAKRFLEHSDEVWGTYHGYLANIPEGCRAVSIHSLESLTDSFDILILAAGNFSLPPKELADVNIGLTQKLVSRFKSAKVIFISSVAVYGNHKDVMRENTPFNNPSFYGLAKLSGEAIVQTQERYAILRLTYLYGKSMPVNSFLPAIINKAKIDNKITLFGKGERQQDYLHVDDAAELCLRAGLSEDSAVYLGATGKSFSNLEVAKKIKALLPKVEIEFAGDDTAPWYQFDPSLTQSRLDWHPKISFEDGLKEMLL